MTVCFFSLGMALAAARDFTIPTVKSPGLGPDFVAGSGRSSVRFPLFLFHLSICPFLPTISGCRGSSSRGPTSSP